MCTGLYVGMFSFLLDKYLGVGLLGFMISSCLTLCWTTKLFSRVHALFFISVNRVWKFWIDHVLTKSHFLWVFLVGMYWYLIVLPGHLYIFFVELFFQNYLPTPFLWGIYVLLLSCKISLYILENNFLSYIYIYIYSAGVISQYVVYLFILLMIVLMSKIFCLMSNI